MAEMPPLPQQPYRDDALSRSELMPFRSKKISMLKSRALIPLAATALTCVLLFSIMGSMKSGEDVMMYMKVLATFLVFAMFAGLYFYMGERKNMLWYLVPAAITAIQLWFLLKPYFYVFRTLLPGDIAATGFVSAFIGMFFGAGLMEELLKAVPALIGLAIALHLRQSGQPGNPVMRNLALDGPVDGILVGAAAGAAFILIETLQQYVPNTIGEVMKNTKGDQGLSLLLGMMLLLPRVLNGIIGHMAWAGIFGYFIGLAVSHPKAIWKLLLIGWLLPSVLHGFWNSSSHLLGGAGTYVSGAISLFFFIACVLKAKQLEVSRLGGPIDGHSILAVSPPASAYPAAPAGVVPPAAPGVAGMFTGIATAVEKAVGFTARTTVPNPGAVPGAGDAAVGAVPASGLSIGTGTARYVLAPNQTIDFSSLFSDAGVPAGTAGLITSGPANALEIRNTGTATWVATSAAGLTTSIPPGSSVPAAGGTTLMLGGATIDIQSF
ncbi:PrsW family intramembrane metalloprotease [uncultured Enterovirga sp.]|uniref:PrsW family intramembrane metalloprotease n=1 Tax=uncultured Enterovirga sp. TaxID=2026352 RepID=UPI0035CBC2AD